jgi:hypothetical protein
MRGLFSATEYPREPFTPDRVLVALLYFKPDTTKKYGYAGWFRIKGYLEAEYGIYLSPTSIKKIMALNRRIHMDKGSD